MKSGNRVSFVGVQSPTGDPIDSSNRESYILYNDGIGRQSQAFESLAADHRTVVKQGLSSFVATCYVLIL